MATAKKVAAKKSAVKTLAPAAKKTGTSAKTTAAAKRTAPAKASPGDEVKKRTPNAAFMKALTPSPELAAVVGSTPLPRTEVVSKLWTYIKKNDLQDASNRRQINADTKLQAIFGKPQVSMFELASLIGKHIK